jgi:hypothetical protein
MQFGSQFPNGSPKNAVGWLKNVSSPTRNGKFPAWSDEAPQFPQRSCHVRNEKDRKDAQDRIEAAMSGTRKIAKTHRTASKLSG